MAGKFELKKTNSGKFVFNLKASNGRVILTSQTYARKAGALEGIESVRRHAVEDAFFERKLSKQNEPYFVLKASNTQIIATSQMYAAPSSMEQGIASVKANAPEAVIEVLDA
jgi:uncharacterized protein YegP (UPF0339 family)